MTCFSFLQYYFQLTPGIHLKQIPLLDEVNYVDPDTPCRRIFMHLPLSLRS